MSSKSDIAISAHNVSKAYQIAHNAQRSTTMAEAIVRRLKNPIARSTAETFWALKDVSFDVKRGEVVGIIGRNGAGKSTLLKVLSRITEPTTGEIDLYGRVGSLLEVGTGFHPELTGRENIYLNGGILGMTRREIARQFDAIIDFAEVEKFLDTPVKRYSSGMYVRLAFAVAAHLNPEILIIDEVLAVGDVRFQNKCLGKMKDVAAQGRTVLFVSHNMPAVEQLCSRVIRLAGGQCVGDSSNVSDEIRQYLRGDEVVDGRLEWRSNGKNVKKSAEFEAMKMALVDDAGTPLSSPIHRGVPVWVELTGNIGRLDPLLSAGFVLSTADGQQLFYCENTDTAQEQWPILKVGENTLRAPLPIDLLNEGEYRIELIAALFGREFICQPGVSAPSLTFELQGCLSDSPYWRHRRGGVMAPIIRWQAVGSPRNDE